MNESNINSDIIAKQPEPKLNQKQQYTYDLIKSGVDVFCSGVGGTGKSFLIHKLKKDFGHETLFLSTTGKSAVDIGGETFHSGMSIPIGHPTTQTLARISSRVSKLFSRGGIKRIVLDEASMLTPGGMYSFRQRLRKFQKGTKSRKENKIQIIFFCDMGQLGSIMNNRERSLAVQDYKTDKFYRMRQFEDIGFTFVELTEILRQEDIELKKMLGHIRSGKGHFETKKDKRGKNKKIFVLDKEVMDAIDYFNKNCYKYPLPRNSMTLATTNSSVAKYNEVTFNENKNPCGTYTATVTGNFKAKNASADEILNLKEGLKVILLKNDVQDRQYVNGSTGTISAMTSEGVYVQLDVHIGGGNNSAPEVFIEPYKWKNKEYTMEPNENGEEELVQYTSGTFEQIPLKQCSALSVHRSQGQTLDKAVIDLGFGAGWATGLTYVSLSRMRTIEGIFLKRKIRPEDVVADIDALDWLDENLKEFRELDFM